MPLTCLAGRRNGLRWGGCGLAMLLVLSTAACEDHTLRAARQITGGEPARAHAAVRKYGCGSCHVIPGIDGARGVVGPPLDRFGARSYIAGNFPNDPSTLVRWIQHPQQMEPMTAMPEMGVTEQDARDIAAYLYTLK